MMGAYPGAMFEDYGIEGGAHYVTAPDVASFLSAFSGLGLTYDAQTVYEFDTMVELLQAAGLDMTLSEGGPYTLFVPTDQAFEALPEGTLDALMEDSAALQDILLHHVVQGSLDYDTLAERGAVTTLQGADISVTPSDDDGFTFRLNDDAIVQNFDYPFLNGTRVWFIDSRALTPPEM